MRRARARKLVLGMILLAALAGSDFFFLFYRDNFATHFPARAIAAESLLNGHFPYWNFRAGGGQPLAGNPNTLTFYPTTILYLLFPVHWAFNLHFVLHLVLGFLFTRMLSRKLGASAQASVVAAGMYLLSGVVVSTLTFYNLVCAVALLPLILLSALEFFDRPSGITATLLGGGCGLLGLAGEPVMILSAAFLLGFLSLRRLALRQLPLVALCAIVALAVVSPLLVAYSEIGPEVERSFQRYSASTVLAASFEPRRIPELLGIPSTFLGAPRPVGVPPDRPWPPLIPFATLGAIIVPAVFSLHDKACRRMQVAALLLLVASFGRFNPIIAATVESLPSSRIIRYPEKLLIPFTLLVCLLLAVWMDREKKRRATLFVVVAGVALALLYSTDTFSLTTIAFTVVQLTALFLVCVRPLGSTMNETIAVALTLTCLVIAAVRFAPVDMPDPYIEPSPITQLAPRRVYRDESSLSARGGESGRTAYRLAAGMVDPVFGAAHGLRYAFDRSPEGMYSYLSRIVQERMRVASPTLRLRYLRMLGVEAVITQKEMRDPYVQRMFETNLGGHRLLVYGVRRPLPRVMSVRSLLLVQSVNEAVKLIESSGFNEQLQTVAPARGNLPSALISVMRFSEGQQILRVEVEAPAAGILLFNETYFSAWDVRDSDGRPLAIVPLNIDRLGVVVPKGTTGITLQFGRKRPLVNAAMLLSAVALAAWFYLFRRSRKVSTEPAT